MYNIPLTFCQWNKIERHKTESESKPFIFYIFPEIFSNNKESKKKRTKERKKANVIGLLWEKKLSRDLPDFEIYNEILQNLVAVSTFAGYKGEFWEMFHTRKIIPWLGVCTFME